MRRRCLSPRRGCWASALVATICVAGLTTSVAPASAWPSSRLKPTPSATRTRAATKPERLVFDSDRTGHFEIYTVNPDGSDLVRLSNDPNHDSWWPRRSPDGKHIIFYRTPAGTHDLDYTATSLWMMSANGSNLTLLRAAGTDGWELQGHAEWSPDGSRLVMFGGARLNPQIFVTDARGRNARPITDRGGQNLDPSWSPDGRTIAFVGCPQSVCYESDYEIYTIASSSTPAAPTSLQRITNDQLRDHDPAFRPGDGATLAWLTNTSPTSWNIRARTGDQAIRRLTDDAIGINSRPEWSRNGATIYFHRVDEVAGRFRLYAMEPDGSNRRLLPIGLTGNDEYPGT